MENTAGHRQRGKCSVRWSGGTEGKVCPGEREKFERKATDKREDGRECTPTAGPRGQTINRKVKMAL